ncbi:flagellar basal-body rod protein FlgB [Xaviernesmea oryzae]|uniref:Flagellar basal body rod protein FlgB n=1 Tax=Xaviernesmea oryzae TaxID=464029 RepID=A0A1Q9ASE6_9HYPH|nr:flagellar basal body rod protein FlgB [Xaviernesmea oryzae]OLP58372.1 flagellar basal-body rod protein FlgB [Xaviernesmea oryzae]SEL47241.1 flagellar basal-body rod protein FlgB [Xaviernesmea oryzae]
MQPIQLFDLASRQAQWLAVRQNVVAGNIANVNTPGYAAKDVKPFESVLRETPFQLATTNPAHFLSGNSAAEVVESSVSDGNEMKQSGNTVSMEKELMKTGEIKRDFDLSTNLVKSFNRMMLLTVRR